MKKRILAAILAVAMVFSVCTIASADAATPVLAEDYEGETVGFMAFNDGTVVTDPKDANNKVLSVTDANWGSHNSDYFPIDGVSNDKEYTIKFRVMGDIGMICITRDNGALFVPDFQAWASTGAAMQSQDWQWVVTKLTGKERYAFGLQVQAAGPFYNCTMYIDDIEIYEGDLVDELSATLPTPEPEPIETPEPEPIETSDPEPIETPTPGVNDEPSDEPSAGTDATATAGTDATATAAPTTAATPAATVAATPAATASATATPETPVKPKVTIKFKKKKVTIKKGKKKVLKVTLKNAKKAKFSVNKKGKKVVKLSKKKAKSVTVKGKKKGKATITAKASGKKATCKVTVKK